MTGHKEEKKEKEKEEKEEKKFTWADGRGQAGGPIKGSTRGPRGPKKLSVFLVVHRGQREGWKSNVLFRGPRRPFFCLECSKSGTIKVKQKPFSCFFSRGMTECLCEPPCRSILHATIFNSRLPPIECMVHFHICNVSNTQLDFFRSYSGLHNTSADIMNRFPPFRCLHR